MTFAAAMVVAFGIALPHSLSLRAASPTTAAALWASSLILRAVATVIVVLYLVLFLPQTGAFGAVTHWCWNAALPLLATHLGLKGHSVGDAATVLPGLVVLCSALSVLLGIFSAAHTLRRVLTRHTLGRGPQDSVIVGGRDVLLGAAGVLRPRIVVSAGALTALDDEELAAGLAHERGHIARKHRYLLLLGASCAAAGRFIPGGRRALAQLAFHLERDADRFALRRHDALALASAICKSATPRPISSPSMSIAFSTLRGSGVNERLRELLDERPHVHCRRPSAALPGLATLMVVLTVASTALVPATAYAGARSFADSEVLRHCSS